jgi:SAM-dependent methyltransferase
MTWLGLGLIIVALIVACFSLVVMVGAPYLPTLRPQIITALELISLKPGETLLELGCGDGRVLLAAAKQGLNAVGYEINPLLAAVAYLRTRRYRKQVRVVWGNFWRKSWPPANAIFVFLLDRYMHKLDKKCMQYNHKPIKLVSFAFPVPGRSPDKEQAGVYLYKYSD